MPKMKTKKSAAKRFKKTGSGKVKFNKSGNRHLSTRKVRIGRGVSVRLIQ